MKRRLIITADDFGYSDSRNEGIVECYQSGAITRASLIVNAAASNSAAQLAQRHGIPLGLHLNLTEGFPVSPLEQVPSLVSPGGVMIGKSELRAAVLDGKVNLKEVNQEILAQIEQFQEMCGCLPQYVDGHNHAHVIPGILEVFTTVLCENSIFESRLPFEPHVKHCSWIKDNQYLRSIVEDSVSAAKIFTDRGIRCSNGFIGMVTMGSKMTFDRLKSRIIDTFTTLENCDKDSTAYLCANSVTTCSSAQGSQPYCDISTDCERSNGIRLIQDSMDQSSEKYMTESCLKDSASSGYIYDENMASKNSAVNSKIYNKGQYKIGTVSNVRNGETGVVTLELMVHPGYPSTRDDQGCGSGADDFSCSGNRKHELNVLTSRELLDWYREQGITLVPNV